MLPTSNNLMLFLIHYVGWFWDVPLEFTTAFCTIHLTSYSPNPEDIFTGFFKKSIYFNCLILKLFHSFQIITSSEIFAIFLLFCTHFQRNWLQPSKSPSDWISPIAQINLLLSLVQVISFQPSQTAHVCKSFSNSTLCHIL